MKYLYLLFFPVLLNAQIVDCLPTARTLQTELLKGNVRSVWECERLPDSSIWEERWAFFDTLGYLERELRYDTARHLERSKEIVYRYNEHKQILSRDIAEYQLTKGKTPLQQYQHTITYTYDKNGRFANELIYDSNKGDTTYLQFVYWAGGWISSCAITDKQKMTYNPRNVSVSYRYNHQVCVEKIDYYFDDHARQQLFVYDNKGRLSEEKWAFKSRKPEDNGALLARFGIKYDYNDLVPESNYPTALNISDYYQKTIYYDAIPLARTYEYSERDKYGNWQLCVVRYNDKQTHSIRRKIVYW